MSKVLWPRTIIPTELYVERKADKQLAQIISDMGRPGYILVARQMGKTNLLINAKRKYSSENSIIAYIDLSNRYDTDRQCFRSIIDTILSTNEDKLSHLIETIHNNRETKRIPAYTEHSSELRLILDSIDGKLIIILDEIDSLTAADYSDKIFAQIRSVYFERVNYSSLEKLTYVLSGVAEPSEIIKDKSISPFNIGQRIVLGDFDYEEFCDFIKRTKIAISSETASRIFYWTNGNPRMTWDICSEIEDLLIANTTVNPDAVDAAVVKIYLTNFDVPPIDHIRTLVESSQELRDGIMSILYGKGDSISDEVKSKLYLSGILDSKFAEGIIKIKNRIIERSLDESWLESIVSKDYYSKSNAEAAFRDSKFDVAIEQYNHCLINDDLDEIETQYIYYKLACSYFYVGDYQKAIDCFDKYIFDKKNYKAIYIEGMYLKSICQLALGDNVSLALQALNEIIQDTDINDDYHWRSSINVVSAANRHPELINIDDAKTILSKIISNKDNIKSDDILSIAYLFAGDYESSTKLALDYYLLSVKHAHGLNKVKPYLRAITKEKSNDIYNAISDLLIENPDSKLLIHSNPSNIFNIDTLFEFIEYSLENKHDNELIKVFDAFIFHDNNEPESEGLFSQILFGFIKSTTNQDYKRFLCEYLLAKGRTFVPPEVIFGSAKLLLFKKSDDANSAEIYFSGFQNYVEGRPDFYDITNFETRISECIKNKEPSKALTYSTQLLNNAKGLDEQEQIKLILVYYLRMLVCDEDEKCKLYNKINELLVVLETSEKYSGYYSTEMLKEIKKHATNIYRQANPITTFKQEYKIGRNSKVEVVYRDGTIEKGKYKKYHDDIASGKCVIKA
ncbi:AAA-like domain-containing protein [Aeromonas veronii]|uniref:AAA-like domain-containing protein n=1 Tax=Aeromonas veronii TaxID=654 RepID=UPI003A29D307